MSEPMFDGLTLLVAELVDYRDRDAWTHGQFMALLGRFAEAVARDAIERQDELRVRFDMPQPPKHDEPPAGKLRIADVEWLKCPYCAETLRSPNLDLHLPSCTRAFELGALPTDVGLPDMARTGTTEQINALPEPLRSKVRDWSFTVDEVADHVKDKLRGGAHVTDFKVSSSMGPAAVVQAAAQPDTTETAARETPAGPATQSTLPAAGGRTTSLSQESVAPATGGAEPPKVDRRCKVTDEQEARTRAEFAAACAANGGRAPYGWRSMKARELGLSPTTMHRILDPVERERRPYIPPRPDEPPDKPTTDSPAARLVKNALKVLASESPRPRPPPSAAKQADEDLPHTETPACWCRKKRATRDNVWCKLRAWQKPASEHAALRTPEPRAERFKTRRIEGTRY